MDDRPVIAVDWDGVVVDNAWPEHGDWLPGAKDGLRALDKLGRVIIHSCRVATAEYPSKPNWQDDTYRSVEEVDAEIAGIWQKLNEIYCGHIEIWQRPYKPPAAVYIDDRALWFDAESKYPEQEWDYVVDQVRRRLEAPAKVTMTVDEKTVDVSDRVEVVSPPFDMGLQPGVMIPVSEPEAIRVFETGATRDTDEGKLELARFFSPEVMRRRAEYMHENRVQSDGSLRDGDNWKKGIPQRAYMDSLMRHVHEVWEAFEGPEDIGGKEFEDALCAIMFNAEGMLYELLKGQA